MLKGRFRPILKKYRRAQTAVEYMLLLAVVVTVTIIGFYRLGPRTQYAANLYFQRAAAGIVGARAPQAGPEPINGGWCEDYDQCSNQCGLGTQTRRCACPVPSNGGAPCYGPSTRSCRGPLRATNWGIMCMPIIAGGNICRAEPVCLEGACCDENVRPAVRLRPCNTCD